MSKTRLALVVEVKEITTTINGYRIQGIDERSTLIVDGKSAILCTPLEYRLAILFLTAPGKPLRLTYLMGTMHLGNRRSLGKLLSPLREKLDTFGMHLLSIPNYGYMLEYPGSNGSDT